VPIPLILQIQQAAIDSSSSVTEALRKAKLACTKLGLTEFGDWVDRELNGYMGILVKDLPKYRILHGIPDAYNPCYGWQPILFRTAKGEASWSHTPIGMSSPALEQSIQGAQERGEGNFSYPFSPETAAQLRKALPFEAQTHVKLAVSQISEILNVVRNIILEWTLDMEKQGILGAELTFSDEERAKSVAATAQTINNIHIAQVGAFVQTAENSVVQGGVDAVLNLDRVHQFVEQVEQLLSAADVPKSVKEDTEAALSEVKQATAHPHESGKLRAALQRVGRAVAPAGEHLLRQKSG
jgi:AbiTii